MLKRLAISILSLFLLFPGLEVLIGIAQISGEQKAAASSHPSTASRLPLKPCRVPGLKDEVLCGKCEVYENRFSRSGRKIALNIVVLPALSSTPAPDPLFRFAGGPGQAATESASEDAEFFADIRRERDIVLVDQRGTGLSNPLKCEFGDLNEVIQAFLAGDFPTERFTACRAQLEQRADLRFYTTPVAMDDIDEVRSWLGYQQINLCGISYGSRAALVYLRQYPDHVRTAILQGAVPVSQRNPLYSPRDAQRSLDRLLDDCAAEETCAKAFPNLRQDVQTVFSQLARTPAKIRISDPRMRLPAEIELSREIFAGGCGGYSTTRILSLPSRYLSREPSRMTSSLLNLLSLRPWPSRSCSAWVCS